MAMPCAFSAAGSAPTTSARPPVLTSGKTSEATARTVDHCGIELVDHGLGDQADAALGAAEALGVELRILADHQALGDVDAAVDDHLA